MQGTVKRYKFLWRLKEGMHYIWENPERFHESEALKDSFSTPHSNI
jgi:hypothetical protein